MIFEQGNGMVGGEDPVIERSFGARSRRCPRLRSRFWRRLRGQGAAGVELEQRRRRSIEQFFRPKLLQLLLHSPQRAFTRNFRGAKLAGGEIQRGEANPVSHLRQRCQEIIFFGPEKRIRRCSGRDHARDFAAHEFLGEASVFHLLADGDLETFANELADVAFRRVVRHSAHGHGDAFFFVARSERDLQFFRGHNRVIEEELIKIAEAEKQQCGGMFFLDGGVLPHQRSGGLRHYFCGKRAWRGL
jgi:hypothetical protein